MQSKIGSLLVVIAAMVPACMADINNAANDGAAVSDGGTAADGGSLCSPNAVVATGGVCGTCGTGLTATNTRTCNASGTGVNCTTVCNAPVLVCTPNQGVTNPACTANCPSGTTAAIGATCNSAGTGYACSVVCTPTPDAGTACVAGATQPCTNGCAGTQTCVLGVWGSCICPAPQDSGVLATDSGTPTTDSGTLVTDSGSNPQPTVGFAVLVDAAGNLVDARTTLRVSTTLVVAPVGYQLKVMCVETPTPSTSFHVCASVNARPTAVTFSGPLAFGDLPTPPVAVPQGTGSVAVCAVFAIQSGNRRLNAYFTYPAPCASPYNRLYLAGMNSSGSVVSTNGTYWIANVNADGSVTAETLDWLPTAGAGCNEVGGGTLRYSAAGMTVETCLGLCTVGNYACRP